MVKGKIFKLETPDGEFDVRVSLRRYASNGSIAIVLYYDDDGAFLPLCNITVNLDNYDGVRKRFDEMFNDGYPQLRYACQFVDTNNFEWAPWFIENIGIGRRAFAVGYSGYCSYPLYAFDLDKLAELESEAY